MWRTMLHMRRPPEETRQQILDVARSLMTSKGYTAVGLAELVAAAGVPKGSFYYYFKSKDDFGKQLLEEYFSRYLSTMDRLLLGQGTGSERLLAYFHHWANTQGADLPDEKCLVVKLGPEVCDLSDDMRTTLKSGTDTIVERIQACVAQGLKDGSLSGSLDPHALAESLYQLWLGASLLAKVGHSTAPFDVAMSTTRQLLSP